MTFLNFKSRWHRRAFHATRVLFLGAIATHLSLGVLEWLAQPELAAHSIQTAPKAFHEIVHVQLAFLFTLLAALAGGAFGYFFGFFGIAAGIKAAFVGALTLGALAWLSQELQPKPRIATIGVTSAAEVRATVRLESKPAVWILGGPVRVGGWLCWLKEGDRHSKKRGDGTYEADWGYRTVQGCLVLSQGPIEGFADQTHPPLKPGSGSIGRLLSPLAFVNGKQEYMQRGNPGSRFIRNHYLLPNHRIHRPEEDGAAPPFTHWTPYDGTTAKAKRAAVIYPWMGEDEDGAITRSKYRPRDVLFNQETAGPNYEPKNNYLTGEKARAQAAYHDCLTLWPMFEADGVANAQHFYGAGFYGWADIASRYKRATGTSYVLFECFQPFLPPENDTQDDIVWNGLPKLEFVVNGIRFDHPDGQGGWYRKQWTNNAAAILWWYLTVRLGIDQSAIDLNAYNTAYRICNETVRVTGLPSNLLPAGSTFAAYDRYTINGTVSSDEDPAKVLPSMLEALGTQYLAEIDGKIRIVAGAERPLRGALSSNDFLERLAVAPSVPIRDRVNSVEGTLDQSSAHLFSSYDLPRVRDIDRFAEGPPSARKRTVYSRNLGRLRYITEEVRGVMILLNRLRKAAYTTIYQYRISPGRLFRRMEWLPGDKILLADDHYFSGNRECEIVESKINDDMSIDIALREAPRGLYRDVYTTDLPVVPSNRSLVVPANLIAPENLRVQFEVVVDAQSRVLRALVTWEDIGYATRVWLTHEDGTVINTTDTRAGRRRFDLTLTGLYIVSAVFSDASGNEGRISQITFDTTDTLGARLPDVEGLSMSVVEVDSNNQPSRIELRWTSPDISAVGDFWHADASGVSEAQGAEIGSVTKPIAGNTLGLNTFIRSPRFTLPAAGGKYLYGKLRLVRFAATTVGSIAQYGTPVTIELAPGATSSLPVNTSLDSAAASTVVGTAAVTGLTLTVAELDASGRPSKLRASWTGPAGADVFINWRWENAAGESTTVGFNLITIDTGDNLVAERSIDVGIADQANFIIIARVAAGSGGIGSRDLGPVVGAQRSWIRAGTAPAGEVARRQIPLTKPTDVVLSISESRTDGLPKTLRIVWGAPADNVRVGWFWRTTPWRSQTENDDSIDPAFEPGAQSAGGDIGYVLATDQSVLSLTRDVSDIDFMSAERIYFAASIRHKPVAVDNVERISDATLAYVDYYAGAATEVDPLTGQGTQRSIG